MLLCLPEAIREGKLATSLSRERPGLPQHLILRNIEMCSASLPCQHWNPSGRNSRNALVPMYILKPERRRSYKRKHHMPRDPGNWATIKDRNPWDGGWSLPASPALSLPAPPPPLQTGAQHTLCPVLLVSCTGLVRYLLQSIGYLGTYE